MHTYERRDTEGLMVEALCADYGRRQRLIDSADTVLRTRIECRYINIRLFDAVRTCAASDEEAMLFMREIGTRKGYAHSDSVLSESAYKEKKRQIRRCILERLHLI